MSGVPDFAGSARGRERIQSLSRGNDTMMVR